MSNYSFTKAPIITSGNQKSGDCIILLCTEDNITKIKKGKNTMINESHDESKKILSAMQKSEFCGKKNEQLYLVNAIGEQDLLLIGVSGIESDKKSSTEDQSIFRLNGIAEKVASTIKSKNIESVSISIEHCTLKTILKEFVIAFTSSLHSFSKYLKKDKKKKNKNIEKVFILSKSIEKKDYDILNNTIDSIYKAKDLITEPGNVLFPESYAEIIKESFKKMKDIKIKILDKKEMQKLGMNLILGVSVGSDNDPKLVTIEYMGNKDSKKIDYALVGKGVTFDSGGLDIKTHGHMLDMKSDMGGSAVTFASTLLLAKNNIKKNIVAIMPLVENTINGKAQKPGDIVKSMSGQTVEILNTDAEGRLILADAIHYVIEKYKPEHVIDLATLTGAIVVGLGNFRAGLFSNSNTLSEKISSAGESIGELCWRFPIGEEYSEMLKSKIADMKNISGTGVAGSITAACFLENFIGEHKSWAHLDIAGICMNKKGDSQGMSMSTGWGVRLINKLIEG